MNLAVFGKAARLTWAAGPGLVILYAAGILLAGVLPVAAAWLGKNLMDALAQPGATETAGALRSAVMLAAVGVVVGVVPYLTNFLSAELGRRIAIGSQERLCEAVNSLPGLARFENPDYLDRLELARQAGDSGPGQMFQSSIGILQAVLTSAGFLTALAVLNPWLALVVLAAAVPGLLTHLAFAGRRTRLALWEANAGRRLGWLAGLFTHPSAAKELRLYGTGRHFTQRVLSEQRRLNKAHRGLEAYETGMESLLLFIGGAVGAGGLIWAVTEVRAGSLTVGGVFLVLAALGSLQSGLGAITTLTGECRQATLLFGHHLAVVEGEFDLALTTRPVAVPPLRDAIEFRGVWFRYADDLPWVLRDANLRIPAGTSCALVGINGSGKSTIVKLLCRFYDPQIGSITWDGTDLREMDPQRLRARIGMLSQDFMRYELSAHENVALGDLEHGADPSRVAAAAELAGADGFIAGLPDGYQTMLTRFLAKEGVRQSGVQLSGGQWQRVALARTLLRSEADLQILDEPSSSLDADAECEIHQRLKAFRAGRTSILISHRFNVVSEADTIVVLAGGTVVETGSHAELMARDSRYSRLFLKQANGYTSRVPR